MTYPEAIVAAAHEAAEAYKYGAVCQTIRDPLVGLVIVAGVISLAFLAKRLVDA